MLPEKFTFLTKVGTLPKLVAAGLQYLGIKEYPGTGNNNPVIMNMAKQLGIADIYSNDETAWCGVAMFFLCKLVGKPLPDVGKDRYNYLRAATFLKYGSPVTKGQEMLGDIAVFDRPGGKHVGIIIAESDKTFFVMGGNQSNSFSIMEIEKSRLMQARRYYSIAAPSSVKKYRLNSSGNISTNEA